MQRYELGKLLGQGAFAKVFYAKNLKTNQGCAIKVINKDKVLKVGVINQIKREIQVMRLVRHPNVVQLYEVMASRTKMYFVMEYVNGGDLFDQVNKGKLKECVVRKCFQQLISAVDFCHSRGVFHRDLKLENLLLDEHGNLKVSDFGLSALTESKQQDGLLHTLCGTPAYVAPEVINKKGYDGVKADIWSCGVILFVLMAGYFPFNGSNLTAMYWKITKGEFKCPNYFPSEVCNLLLKILDPNPESRISTRKIMQNSWFNKGSTTKPTRSKELTPLDPKSIHDGKVEFVNPTKLNAFDIISLSWRFDLSGLFEGKHNQKETWFASRKTALSIVLKLRDIARDLRLGVKKEKEGVLTFEGSEEGKKGVLSIDAEISEVTSSFHLVELKKSGGDTLEYQELLNNDIRPALNDIVWVWQGREFQQMLRRGRSRSDGVGTFFRTRGEQMVGICGKTPEMQRRVVVARGVGGLSGGWWLASFVFWQATEIVVYFDRQSPITRNQHWAVAIS
ncbi:hypothetical protein MRB53_003821 [Persea americana]|uniref:Uncharacterized protein n=1 Tax=Persea americana TaxID=3435 RepID=A0ACC2MYS2_PERAE|nr:hypothetical protein MRB53_003821 [Persea americana]